MDGADRLTDSTVVLFLKSAGIVSRTIGKGTSVTTGVDGRTRSEAVSR
jgi:hypothetical protein